jgi:hypothetical protein
MTTKSKTNRTQIKDLAVAEQELKGQEMAQVQGGGLNTSRSGLPGTERAVIICIRCGKVDVDKNPCCPPPSKPSD